VHKNNEAGVVDDEQLHCGPFGVPSGSARIGYPPIHVLIMSGFVDGGVQLLQRIVNDFELDDQDLCDAQVGGNNQFGMCIIIMLNVQRATAVKSRWMDMHKHTSFIFTSKNVFMFPKT
jgi:hypothetical protein